VTDQHLDPDQVKRVVEAALMCADEPLSLDRLAKVFRRGETDRDAIRGALEALETDCAGRGFELKRVASGYRFQVGQEMSPWVSRLWEERPPRYSRALMETLALIVYRQPITRGEIEQVRGVAVSSNIIRTLLEREWVKVVGYKEVPGRPAMYGTTKAFLDYFNLKSLKEMPALDDVRALVEPVLQDEAALEGGPGPADVPAVDANEHEPRVELADDLGAAGGAEVVPLPTADRAK
jgi:segregation and condensation protein B